MRIYELIQSIPITFGFAFLGGKLIAFVSILPILIKDNLWGWSTFFLVGFVFYGALIGLIIGIFIESKRRNKPITTYTDTFLRLLPLGQGIGRIGCYFNGCCYGIQSDSLIAIPYPINGVYVSVIPVQIIEALFCLSLGIVLLTIQSNKQGFYTHIYLICYAIFRFIIEFFRGDEIRGLWIGLSTSQWISLVIIIFSLSFYLKNRNARV